MPIKITTLESLEKEAKRSRNEKEFENQLSMMKINGWVREHKFHPTRRWRFDFAWPEIFLAAEIDGAAGRGRHTTYKGYTEDAYKLNSAQLLGWTVYRFTGKMVFNGYALQTIEKAIMQKEE